MLLTPCFNGQSVIQFCTNFKQVLSRHATCDLSIAGSWQESAIKCNW